MIRHGWSIICKESVIDSASNNISLLNVLEAINIEIEKANKDGDKVEKSEDFKMTVPISFQVVTLYITDNPSAGKIGKGRITFVDPNGVQISSIDYDINFKKKKRVRHRSHINGLACTTSGEYKFKIQYKVDGEENWVDAATLPLFITVRFL